jgi:GNAT superfamily N-acetyltransferase
MEDLPRIRAPVLGDSPAVATLLEELGYPADVRRVERRLDFLQQLPDYALRVAEIEGAVVGLGAVNILWAVHTDQPTAMVTALVVAETARRRGVGKVIVESLEGVARSHDCGRIIVTTALHRAGAHAFYEQMGYDFTGRRYAKSLL